MPKPIKCPQCKGKGTLTITVSEYGKAGSTDSVINCVTCHGNKTVTAKEAASYQAMLDSWCRCKQDHGSHHEMAGMQDIYICNHCGKVTQTG